jgi:penicillin-binding protein 2
MACYAASLARGETYTTPTLLHDPNRPQQHTDPIGLTPAQRQTLLQGMIGCTTASDGTARTITEQSLYAIPGVPIAGKTGTAQVRVVRDGKVGNINDAWFICFAPADHPQIAMAVMLEGENVGEAYQGGMYAAPVAALVLKKYFEKKAHPDTSIVTPFKSS